MRNLRKGPIAAVLAGCVCAAHGAVDLGAYKGCAANDGQFNHVQLYKGPVVTSDVASNGVLKFTFVKQPGGFVDVYFIQKMGTVQRYNGKTGTVDSLGTITVDHATGEQGLVGVAVRNDFLKNPWMYFNYSSLEAGGTFSFRIARIKLTSDLAHLDNATEKILIKIPRMKVSWHTAGDLQFDDYDDLWAAIGDNQQTDLGPANTADMRGGVLRIHPDETAKGYSVPAGNFGEKYAAFYKAQGKPDVAALFADTSKVKPEIYVKGTRNAYTISVDPVRRWLAWGDVGPDQGKVSEEANLVKEPFYMGWPYFAGEEDMAGISPYNVAISSGSTRAAPVNTNATVAGVKNLPAIREPIFARDEGCSMTGPIFRYDGSNPSPTQFPPQFDRKWLVSGCDGFGFHLMTLDSAGEKITADLKIFTGIHPPTLVDLKQGPDGALYYVSWNLGLYRFEYAGTCKDAALLPEKTGCADPKAVNYDSKLPKAYNDERLCQMNTGIAHVTGSAAWMEFDRRWVSVSAPGAHRIEILDVRGRVVASMKGSGPASHTLPALPGPGYYRLRVISALGEVQAGFSALEP